MRFATESKRMTMSAILSFSMALDIFNTDYLILSSYIKEISWTNFFLFSLHFLFSANYVILKFIFWDQKVTLRY